MRRISILIVLAVVFAFSSSASAESFEGKSSGITVEYEIDLPDGYAKSKKSYPVIYVLHSWGRTHNTQFKCTVKEKCDDNNGSAKKFMEEAVAAGKLDPCILVYPNGMKSTFFADSFDGKKPIETSIIQDLIPHIESKYRAKTGRANRALIGLRLGGYGAIEYGVKFPEMFCAAVSVAGALHDWYTCTDPKSKMPSCRVDMFNGNYSYFLPYSPWFNAQQNKAALKNYGMGIRLVMGDDDEMKMRAQTFGTLLTTLGVPFEFEQVMTCTAGKGPNRPGRNFNCIISKEGRSSFAFIGEHMRKAAKMK